MTLPVYVAFNAPRGANDRQCVGPFEFAYEAEDAAHNPCSVYVLNKPKKPVVGYVSFVPDYTQAMRYKAFGPFLTAEDAWEYDEETRWVYELVAV